MIRTKDGLEVGMIFVTIQLLQNRILNSHLHLHSKQHMMKMRCIFLIGIHTLILIWRTF